MESGFSGFYSRLIETSLPLAETLGYSPSKFQELVEEDIEHFYPEGYARLKKSYGDNQSSISIVEAIAKFWGGFAARRNARLLQRALSAIGISVIISKCSNHSQEEKARDDLQRKAIRKQIQKIFDGINIRHVIEGRK